MRTSLPPVWFERPVLPELQAEVGAVCRVLGPATAADPYAGIEHAVAAVAGPQAYGSAFMDRATQLVVIARSGIGYDAIDVAEATRRGIAVCNTPDGPTISTAEHAVTLMLLIAKGVKRAGMVLRDGTSHNYYVRHDGIELDGKILGLVGFGRVGRHVARIAGGLGMQVLVFDPYLDPRTLGPDVRLAASLEDLLGSADVVSLHMPLTESSRGLFGERQFGAMKRGAVFVNTARGGLVDQEALLAALEAGQLFGAGLDVTTPEPLPVDHPLLRCENVVVTPHIASATTDGRVRVFRAALDRVLEVLGGRRPDSLVNPEVWDRLVEERIGARV